MQMVKNALLVLLLVWLGILGFMPKQELYYTLEEALAKQEIALNEKKISEGMFGLTLEEVSVYVKGIKVATIKEIDVLTLLFYTRLKLDTLHMDDSLKQMVPQETQEAIFSHSIVAPTQIKIEAQGSFGGMRGQTDVLNRTVHLDFNESQALPMLGSQLKKSEKGWVYETSF
jgi:hypothetical protein